MGNMERNQIDHVSGGPGKRGKHSRPDSVTSW